MNTGCGDAVDLSWKLAATLAGWGGPRLLKSYEIERRQVGERNVAAARFAPAGPRKWRSLWRPRFRDNTPASPPAHAPPLPPPPPPPPTTNTNCSSHPPTPTY